MLLLSSASWLDLADYRFCSQLEDSTDLSDVYISPNLEEMPFHFSSKCLWDIKQSLTLNNDVVLEDRLGQVLVK